MLKVIAAVALVVVFLVPAVAAFAADEAGNGGDRDPYVVQELTQVEPATPATVAGSDQPNFGPYFEQRLENMEH